MRAVLYSGGQTDLNFRLHEHLYQMTGLGFGKASFTYIPFCTDGMGRYYEEAKARYRMFGFGKFHCLPIDRPIKDIDRLKALRSDVIYLAGGNTFYFLYHLKKSGLIQDLRDYSSAGGILAGLSAGSLLLTPNINLASYPEYDCDDNDVGIKDLRALNLVKFEYFPHYINSKKYNDSLLAYSVFTKNPIYAVPDGQGIVVDGHDKFFYGKVKMFYRGQNIPLS